MQRRHWWLLTLLLPLVPVLAYGMASWLLPAQESAACGAFDKDWMQNPEGLFVGNLGCLPGIQGVYARLSRFYILLGAIPYVPFALVLILYSLARKMTADHMRRATWLLPLLFLPVCLLWLAYIWETPVPPLCPVSESVPQFVFFILASGFVFVALAQGATSLAGRSRWLRG